MLIGRCNHRRGARRRFMARMVVIIAVLIVSILGAPLFAQTDKPAADQKKEKGGILGKSRTFLFTYAGVIKDLAPGQEAFVWLPIAGKTLEQDAEIVFKNLP